MRIYSKQRPQQQQQTNPTHTRNPPSAIIIIGCYFTAAFNFTCALTTCPAPFQIATKYCLLNCISRNMRTRSIDTKCITTSETRKMCQINCIELEFTTVNCRLLFLRRLNQLETLTFTLFLVKSTQCAFRGKASP